MSVQRRLTDSGDEWIVEERIFSTGKTSIRSYYFRKQLAIRHELKTEGTRRLAGLMLIEKDIRTLSAWVAALKTLTTQLAVDLPDARITFMPKDERVLVMRALFVAVLATYGKMFTTAEGRRTTLQRSDCGADPEHLQTHEWLMHQRHTFAAHSGVDSAEGCNVAIAIDFKLRTSPKVFAELHQPAMLDPKSLDEASALLSVLHTSVGEKLKKASSFVYDETRKQFPEAKLRKMLKGARGWYLRQDK